MAKVSALCPRTSRARTLLQPPDTYRHTVLLLLLLLQGGRARAFGNYHDGQCTMPEDVQGNVRAGRGIAGSPRCVCVCVCVFFPSIFLSGTDAA